MKVVLATLVAVLATAVLATTASAAQTGRWIPGTNYLISEDDATSFLEKGFDHAYCTGVPRFGHRGSFPDEEFVVFDCDITRRGSGIDCMDTRLRSVKGAHRGYFRIKLINQGDCY